MPEKTVQKEPGKKPAPSKKPKPQQEVVVQISLSELHPFPDHPFQVREDASMQETAESVKEYGVLVPALARPREDGGYELIAGHRRKHACELAGLATMSVAFDSMWKTYTLTLKGRMTHRVELGSDARGNLVRIENALDKMPESLRSVQEQLENLYNQQAAAKAEVGKPFPQEQELAAKTARLIELDMELNLDGKGQPQPEQAIAKSARPSVLDRLKAPPVHGAPEKPHKKEMEAR